MVHFCFLQNVKLHDVVSPYYRIEVTRSYHFYKPVYVEFEHFGACDPSHYQLLCCEDDDESYTMRPVDYDLSFRVQDHISWCTFQTQHFCVYCLFHNNKEPIMNRIGAYLLRPKDFQNLIQFTVEIWFSFPSSNCMKRNEELYAEKGMVLDSYNIFEACSDKSSTNYFTLSYDHNINGWHVDHFGSTDPIIEAKEVNFYNYYTKMEELKEDEECSLFPPRFTVNIRNTELGNATNLDLNMIITLCNNIKERKSLQTATMNLSVPLSITTIEDLSSIGYHHCDKNKANIADLAKYSKQIVHNWQEIAIQMDIHKEKIDTIDADHFQDKCLAMFIAWLEGTTSPCWCKFIQALYAVGLDSVAEEAKMHLILLPESTDLKLDEGNSKVID